MILCRLQLSRTQYFVVKLCLLHFCFIVAQSLTDGTESSTTAFSGLVNALNPFIENKTSSFSRMKRIDWTKHVIVVSSKTRVKLKMGESIQLRLVISASCASDDIEHKFALESSSSTVAYLPDNQKTSFTLSCKFSKPLVEAMESFSNLNRQLFPDSDVTHQADAKAVVRSSDSNNIPSRYDLTGSIHDIGHITDPKNVVMLRTLPRVILDTNVTISTDLLGRSWLLITSNTTSEISAQNHRHTTAQDHSKKEKKIESSRDQFLDVAIRSSDLGDVVHEIPIVVLRNMRPIDFIFRIVLYCFVAFSSVAMGCKTDLGVVKAVLRRPVAPVLGFVAQYVFMPLIAFSMATLVRFDNPAVRLGIFTCGVCPGGGASNIFAFLLNGDLSLSVTMTCISSVFALAMIPLWMFTLGQQFNDDKISIKVPFLKIMQSLSIVIVPLFIGFFINIKFPKIAGKIQKTIKPLSIITIVFILTVGVYSNLYLFRLFQVNTVIAACLLPYIGYILGACLALMTCQPWERVKTISIETGIQNTTVAYLMLTFSLPAPDSDLAAVGSVASALMTPLPLLVITVVYTIYMKLKKVNSTRREIRKLKDKNDNENGDEDNEMCQMTKASSDL